MRQALLNWVISYSLNNIFGPTNKGGEFVRLFICPESSKTGHRIFPKLEMKLQGDNGHKVTKLDISGKISTKTG